MIMTGSGAQHASDAVRALAEDLDAPVAAFRGGRGVMPEDHALGISSFAAIELWPETDALIGIGTRLEMPYMRWTGMMTLVDRPQAPPHLIRIDIDPAEMRRLVPHAGIVADAEVGARALLAAVQRLRPASRRRRSRSRCGRDIAAAKTEARAKIEKVQPQLAYLDVIREVLPRDGLFVTELSAGGLHVVFRLSRSTSRAPTYRRATRARSASASRPRSASRSRIPTSRWSRSPATAASCSACRSSPPPRRKASASSRWCSTTRVRQRPARPAHRFGNRVIGSALDNPDFMRWPRPSASRAIAWRRRTPSTGARRAIGTKARC